MNNIFKIVEFDHTMSLEKYSNPSFLKNILDAKYKSDNNSIIDNTPSGGGVKRTATLTKNPELPDGRFL